MFTVMFSGGDTMNGGPGGEKHRNGIKCMMPNVFFVKEGFRKIQIKYNISLHGKSIFAKMEPEILKNKTFMNRAVTFYLKLLFKHG